MGKPTLPQDARVTIKDAAKILPLIEQELINIERNPHQSIHWYSFIKNLKDSLKRSLDRKGL